MDFGADDHGAEETPATAASSGSCFILLVPCRAAMHGRMALHGTYFQINEVFLCQDLSEFSLKVRQLLGAHLPSSILDVFMTTVQEQAAA